MQRTHLSMIAGLLMAGSAVPVLAQQAPSPAPAQRTETTTTVTKAMPGLWRASKLVGLDVYNNANEKIGDISEILLDPSGKFAGFVVSVGGFLGIGQHDVLVLPDQLKFVNEPLQITTSTSTTTTTTGAGTATTTTRPARDVNVMWYPDHAVMNLTKDQLKAIPKFKYN